MWSYFAWPLVHTTVIPTPLHSLSTNTAFSWSIEQMYPAAKIESPHTPMLFATILFSHTVFLPVNPEWKFMQWKEGEFLLFRKSKTL